MNKIITYIAIFIILIGVGFWAKNKFFPPKNQCVVVKIYDGDTMTLQCPRTEEKTRVRMYCIDTPEMQQKPWGKKSRDVLREMVALGETVRLEAMNKDRYGRVVGEVFYKKQSLNLAQVEAGQAAVYEGYCKNPEYKEAETVAKKAKLGIWSKRGLHQAPWDWRKKKKANKKS